MSKRWKSLKLKFLRENEDLVHSIISDTKTNGILEVEVDKYKIYKVYFDENVDISELKKKLNSCNVNFLGEEIVEEEDWGAKWRENFKGVRIENFFIRPPWIKRMDKYIDIVIEPGGAFGTGIHETTRLCIEAMPIVLKNNISILDCGCGSGILLISAIKFLETKKMRVREYVGVDIDELSIRESKKNFTLNGISFDEDSFVVSDLKDFNFPEKFDIIFANMLYNELDMNMAKFRSLLNSKGFALFSGILESEGEDFVSLLSSNGFSIYKTLKKGEWLLFITFKGRNDLND